MTTTPSGPAERSKGSRDEKMVRKAMAVPDDERERFIEELKRSVRAGTYEPDAEEIAAAMLADRIAEHNATEL